MLNQQLKSDEFTKNLAIIYERGDLATPLWQHLTIQEAGGPMRDAYRAATREQAFVLGAFLDTLTNPQLANMFQKRTQWHGYLAAEGE